ncbi:DsbA family oxidoreductase [Azospirillum brasilense]|uniref:DsbA family oxidoreductase n=1 Tax=Azospirillum brasilense TaxID=192 RepID=A0A0P0EMX6_AZOBR|nr:MULTISPECIES: DsbA family oxidoreductase [Azospirillum]ALJ35463.1 disulfide bond formation protein DsbA [Azospirillum brasilense]MDW7555681.1 DsbA family oxidoreductase [Azospirillum brasilense]MDW7595608.1 DsbA family oxidoreductase [Azospirillum brasilense]MDW7630613.1 DsbA family oxidoreductase [Azospirillum brasilense]MDX5954191.1 DsbA family oxidoreductase [Azospirillum brasilense]
MLIETYADLICPWCYIGKRRLARALADRPRVQVELRWQPFQLNPDMAPGGMERSAYLAAKFGGTERARQIHLVVEETAERDGLPLRLDRIRRTPNSFDGHRLIRIAARHGLGDRMADALFHAYFVDGLDIGDRDTLAATAAGLGFDFAEIKTLLTGDAETTAVFNADATARQLGLQAVPCYIFNRRYALSGAQEPASFLPLLDLGVEEQEGVTAAAD